ncbi:hypothetical protein E3983_05400 [Legionella israelensis]|uniref:HTH-like domain-containing protein n=1 Tax=Legionella israelensis TaxID=454 RepID=A0AAX1EFF2_9GAMM|nr:hypothetical protein E3983_05400 [Legionella israelensis]
MNKPRKKPMRLDDEVLLPYIRSITDKRSSYGYRRVTILLNNQLMKENKPRVNHKRVYRIMKENDLLLQAYRKNPMKTHDGKVITLRSNTRWCSDCFTVPCANGDKVYIAFPYPELRLEKNIFSF